jgi:5-dehydro-2-deoxygluconokinase
MVLGDDGRLFVLAFDHRGSFQRKFFGVQGEPGAGQAATIADAKRVIFEGMLRAREDGLSGAGLGVLVDEQFGAEIARDAKREGLLLAMPVERSGQDEFDFEYGEDFGAHIEAFDPDFSKVLVRYNPEGNQVMNERQSARLRRLGDWLHERGRRFLFELLVPAEPQQLGSVGGDAGRYDVEVRPGLMRRAIESLHGSGVEPDIWKIEGLDRRKDCRAVVAAARRKGREEVGCIILGRGEDDQKVREWLTTASGVPGFIGFAVGRTSFWDALVDWRAKKITREEAVDKIAHRYRDWVNTFEDHARAA